MIDVVIKIKMNFLLSNAKSHKYIQTIFLTELDVHEVRQVYMQYFTCKMEM